jgi:nitric oxide reductase NorQ protein
MNPVEQLNDLYDGLTTAILAVTVQGNNEDYDAILEAYLLDAGRATAKTSKTKKAPVVTVTETLDGEKKYARPNGHDYFARSWGEHNDVEVIRKARSQSQYVLLYGAPGCGKTAVVEAAFGEDLYTVLGSGDTEVADLVGGYVQTPAGGFDWVDGPLLRAAEEGKPLLIDEVGLIDPKVLSIVYGLMDGRKEYTVTANPERGTVKAKEGFYVIAATNPNAPGVRLSEALLSRFTIQAEMTTDWSLAKKLGAPVAIVTCAQNLAKKQAAGEVSWAPQMRELLAFRDLVDTFGTKWAVSNLLAAAPEMDRPVVADVFTRVFGEEIKPAKI